MMAKSIEDRADSMETVADTIAKTLTEDGR